MKDLATTLIGPSVSVETPLRDECRALIDAAEAEMLAIYAPDRLVRLAPEDLAAPNVQFFVARQNGRPLGCVALVDELRHGVIRRLHVRPEARGLGIGFALMLAVEQAARDIGLSVLRVETGRALAPAIALYGELGYAECPPFGPYPDDGENVFMEKRLL